MQHVKKFADDITEQARKIGQVISQIESSQMSNMAEIEAASNIQVPE